MFVVEERVPKDCVYELTDRYPVKTTYDDLRDDPIGNKFDGRHKVVMALYEKLPKGGAEQ